MPSRRRFYRLAPLAVEDLEEIWRYTFQRWSVEQADRYHDSIIGAFEDLVAGRAKGRPVDIREGYEKYAVGSHLIFYRGSSAGIDVIRILHQRMDAARHL
jgi:toxin ParE1/3/4